MCSSIHWRRVQSYKKYGKINTPNVFIYILLSANNDIIMSLYQFISNPYFAYTQIQHDHPQFQIQKYKNSLYPARLLILFIYNGFVI